MFDGNLQVSSVVFTNKVHTVYAAVVLVQLSDGCEMKCFEDSVFYHLLIQNTQTLMISACYNG
jgi:hypothetical protein